MSTAKQEQTGRTTPPDADDVSPRDDPATAGKAGGSPGSPGSPESPGRPDSPEPGPDPTQLDRELRLARATELARAGHRDAAERMLEDLPDPTASELDLRARIRAQRGELAGADELWAEAQRRSGDANRFAAQRTRIADLQRRRTGTSRGWRRLGAALLALLLLAFLAGATVWALARAGSGDRDLAELRAQQDQILQQLRESAGQPRPPASALPADTELRLAAPGLDVLRAGDRVTVRFQEAVFTGGSVEPTPEAREQLAELGRRIAALGPDVRVQVVGHTAPTDDPTRVEGGGVGLQRADAAAGVLADGGSARDSLTVLSAGSADPPFPGDPGGDAQARNRTVTVEVVPAR